MKTDFTVDSSSLAHSVRMARSTFAHQQAADPDDAAVVAHILRRLTFTAHPDRVEQFAGVVPADVIEEMLTESPLEPDLPELGSDDDSGRIPEWWLEVMGRGDAGLHEKMVWFWHGHFTSSLDKASPALMMRQHMLFRTHALGNFRDFLRDIATDAAMLYWLDGAGSASDAPNQNFAREAMELFTLGRSGSPYTEDDVRAGAIAFSGWWVDGDNDDEVKFDTEAGPIGSIQFLGATVRAGEDAVADAVDAMCDHPACAPFVAARIDTYLSGVEPDDDRRDALAKTFRDAGLELRPLVESIVRDPAFLAARLNRPRSAVEWFIAARVLLETEIDIYSLEGLGQIPFSPPNVAGWPGVARWVSAGAEFAKAEIALDNADDTPTLDPTDPVADVLRRAGLFEVSEATLQTLHQAVGAIDGRRDASTLLHALVAVSPEFSLA
jgi:uncharacterized protein (DUF1800 family)